MLPTGVQGWNSTVVVGATAGKQICYATIAGTTANAGGGSAAPFGGQVGAVQLNDTGTAEVQLYDGISTGGKLIYQGTLLAGGGLVPVELGIQLNVGLFLVVTGGTAPVTTVLWK